MHAQQQLFNICNTAIVGNHHDKSKKNNKYTVVKIYKSIKMISQNHRQFKYHTLQELFLES